MKPLFKILFVGILVSLFSCVKDIDFDQASQLELTPVVKMSFVNFDIQQTQLIDNLGNEIIRVTDTASFNQIQNVSNKEYLQRVEFEFEINNPFNREFRVNFSFLDNNSAETYRFNQQIISANNPNFVLVENVVIANYPNILNSTQIAISLEMIPSTDGSSIDSSVAKTFEFKSGGTLHFRIN